MVPTLIALILLVVAAFVPWIHIHDWMGFKIAPVYNIHIALTYINVDYPKGQGFSRFFNFLSSGGKDRTALMSDFNKVNSWDQFVGVACGYKKSSVMNVFVRQTLGDVCTKAYYTQILAMVTTVVVGCAAVFCLLAIIQFLSGAVMRRSKSYILPLLASALLLVAMVLMGLIGFLIFELFDAERMFFPTTGYLLVFIAMIATGISMCLSSCSREEEDFEDDLEARLEAKLEANEEEQSLMRKEAAPYAETYPQQYGDPRQQGNVVIITR